MWTLECRNSLWDMVVLRWRWDKNIQQNISFGYWTLGGICIQGRIVLCMWGLDSKIPPHMNFLVMNCMDRIFQ